MVFLNLLVFLVDSQSGWPKNGILPRHFLCYLLKSILSWLSLSAPSAVCIFAKVLGVRPELDLGLGHMYFH